MVFSQRKFVCYWIDKAPGGQNVSTYLWSRLPNIFKTENNCWETTCLPKGWNFKIKQKKFQKLNCNWNSLWTLYPTKKIKNLLQLIFLVSTTSVLSFFHNLSQFLFLSIITILYVWVLSQVDYWVRPTNQQIDL